jgi:hypothetical protein
MSSFIHDCDIDIKSRHDEVDIDGITVIDNGMIVLCDKGHPPNCDPVIGIALHTFFLTISINVIL